MRLGIIGTGHMATQMAQAAAPLPGIDVAGVLSRSAERATQFCASLAPAAQGLTEIDKMLGAVDAVYVATPPDQHAAAIRAAIAAKTPVLCEKPLSPSATETKALLAEAQAAGVLVMEAIWTLALPAYRALKARLPAPDGDTQLLFDFSYPLHAPKASHYFDPKTGGVLLDRGVYGLAAAMHLLGPVDAHHAHISRNADGLDASADLRLSHASGASALVTLSLTRMGSNRLEVATTAGAARLGPSSLLAETMLWQDAPAPASGGPAGFSKPGLKTRLKAMPTLRKLKVTRAPKPEFLSYGTSPYAPILRAFQEAVGQDAAESPLVPHRLSIQVAELVAQARNQ